MLLPSCYKVRQKFIRKCVSYYNVWQTVTTKCVRYCKVRHLLQSEQNILPNLRITDGLLDLQPLDEINFYVKVI